MTKMNDRMLPVGIQSFSEIRKKGYVYVDKTDIVWKLVNNGCKYNYLSRPRRFGKSLLVDTLQNYFEGKKELFEGLRIMEMEEDWKQYPVIRLDMSMAGEKPETLRSYFDHCFGDYEHLYGIIPKPTASLTDRFDTLIRTACRQTGLEVVVLIDEYDSPLLHSWGTLQHEECTAVYREVFAVLKADDAYEAFVFITGITKFTQISLFSVLNNLTNISFLPEYAAVCGITKEEVTRYFMPEIKEMGEKNGWDTEETIEQLKAYYDGYHFSADNWTDLFNPFSLVNALCDKKLRNYWAASGATSLLPKLVDDIEIRLKYFENCPVDGDTLETSDVADGGAELLLYQAGYLTIKGYSDGIYLLGIPNYEVRKALYKIVIPTLTMQSDLPEG